MKNVLSILVVCVLLFSAPSFATLSVPVAPPSIVNSTDEVMLWSQTFTTYGTMESIAGIKGGIVVTLQDGDPYPGNGATLGNINGMPIYTAYIDGVEVATLFDVEGGYSLTTTTFIPPASDSDDFGWEPYSGSVFSKIQVEVALTVSPHDSVTVLGDFEVMPVPEPVTMSLLALGGLLLRKRK